MDSRAVCTIVVRGLGLWMIATTFPTVIWGIVQLGQLATASGRGDPSLSPWRLGASAGTVLIFLLGGWLLIDGKEVIDHFQFVTGRCPRCGYDLIKVKGENCPECGLPRSKRNRYDPRMDAESARDASKAH